MFLRGALEAHVCWRCQLHLLKHSAQTDSILHLPTQYPLGVRLLHNEGVSGSAESSSSPFQNAQDSQLEKEEGVSPTLSKSVKPHRAKETGAWRPLRGRALTEYPLGRFYGFRGPRLKENVAELNVKSLGEPAEVIVLQDTGFRFHPPPEIEELKTTEKVDILARLDAEKGLIGQADVEKSIEGFRPKSKIITWDELQSIQRQLVTGFTTSQLTIYTQAFERRKKDQEEKHEVEPSKKLVGAILRKTVWVPGISETGEEFDEDVLRGYGLEALTPKLRLVLRMLHQCWQLEVKDVIESIGEVEFEIRSEELDLLILGQNPILRVISNKLIASQGEKIETFRSRGVIRVTAAKERSEIIVQEIHNMLQSVRYLEVDLDVLKPESQGPNLVARNLHENTYSDSVIEELAQVTETQIAWLPNNTLKISCIDVKHEANSSSRADVARRLLLTSSDLSDQTRAQQVCKEISGPLIAVKYHMTDGMSWRNRLRYWARWTSALSKSTGAHKEADDTPQQGIEESIIENRMEAGESFLTSSTAIQAPISLSQKGTGQPNFQTVLEKPLDHVFWDYNMSTTTSAVVGHVLQEAPTISGVAVAFREDSLGQRIMFRPTVINISRLLGTIPSLSNPPAASLVMRFIPSPWTTRGPQVLTSLPPVEMLFTVDEETKELKLIDVIAVVDSTASDIMIPDRAMDLRFLQRTTSQLRTLHQRQLPQISEFLKDSQLNLTHGRLETPPGLTLPIATHLCGTQILETLCNSVKESIEVEYIFGGLEYRSSLTLDFEGWKLLYTSVEGGKADGRRRELSLQPQRTSHDFSDKEKGLSAWTEEFIEAAYRLVDTLEDFDIRTLYNSRSFIESPMKYKVLKQNKAFRYFDRPINFTDTKESYHGEGEA